MTTPRNIEEVIEMKPEMILGAQPETAAPRAYVTMESRGEGGVDIKINGKEYICLVPTSEGIHAYFYDNGDALGGLVAIDDDQEMEKR